MRRQEKTERRKSGKDRGMTIAAEGPVRIAVIMGKHVTGGIKSVIMNYYRHIDREKIQFDFFVDQDSPDRDYSEIYQLGGKVYEIPATKYPLRNVAATYRLLKQERYEIVHGYLNTLNVFPMFAGWLAGTPVRICENLSTAHPGEKKTAIKNLLRPMSCWFPTQLAANSVYAAQWIYGSKRTGQCRIIRNAIDLERYQYDPALGEKMREQFGLSDCFVLGHIGRYQYQKNHDFLIDIFRAVFQRQPAARLLLVGYGELKEKVFQKIRHYGLEHVVIDVGATEDIIPLYHAMDCFVLPSFYEGLPVVGIEAQATGLPCVFSSEITQETAMIEDTKFLSLSDSPDRWADEILKYKSYQRRSTSKEVVDCGYDIHTESKALEQYYLDCLRASKA